MEFKDYLLIKLQEYERHVGHRASINEFADYLGVSRSLLSYWLAGKIKPSIPNVQLLAETLGNEIYTILGLIPPDENLQYLERNWERLDPDLQQRIIKLVSENTGVPYNTNHEENTAP